MYGADITTKQWRDKRAASRKQSREAWVKARQEGRAIAEAAHGWRQRLDNILRSVAHCQGDDFAKKEAWELFRVRWKAQPKSRPLSPAERFAAAIRQPASST
jgi:hypothetical protein